MFNAYSIRPIGSEKFLEHLKDIQTRSLYDTMIPFEGEVDIHGSIPWASRGIQDPYVSLATAIIANTILEYLHNYEKKEHFLAVCDDKMYWVYNSHCIQLENDYFRRSPFLEMLFEKLLEEVCWEGEAAIEQCARRMRSVLRWSKKSERNGSDD